MSAGAYECGVDEATLEELEEGLLAHPEPSTDRVDAMNALAWALRVKEVPRAHRLAEEAESLSKGLGYTLGRARALRAMAMTVGSVERLHQVWPWAEESKRLFDETGDLEGRAGSRDLLASIHEFVGDLAGGLELALDALAIAQELGSPARQGFALSNIGGILAASGEIDEAIDRLQEGLRLFQSVDNRVGIGTIAHRLAKVLGSVGRWEEALDYARVCQEVAQKEENVYQLTSANTALAEIEAALGRPKEAERLYRAALDALTSDVSRMVVGGEIQVALAKHLLAQGELEKARVELEESVERLVDTRVTIVVAAEAHETLAEVYEGLGRIPEAYHHLRAAHRCREHTDQRDAKNMMAQVKTRAAMESARKDAEIHKLRYVELSQMQTKLVEAEKMALLGRLAAGTAHELNNPLGVLRANHDLLGNATERLLSLVDEADDRAQRIRSIVEKTQRASQEAMARIAAIAESYRRFSHLDQAERTPYDVREGVNSAMEMLEPSLCSAIRIERSLSDTPKIEAWPRELNLAFLTVLQNAVEAIEGTGTVTIETSALDDEVRVRIADTGCGMSDEQLATLFDVAWADGGPRARMRLGLSAAWLTVQKHGGRIDVKSREGVGTTFTFLFPAARATPTHRTERHPERS